MPIPDPERHAHRLARSGWLLAVGGAIVGGWVGTPIAVSGVFLLLLACYSTRDGFLLCGPIAAAESNRAARKGKPWVWRVVYALAAGGVVVGHLNASGGFAALPPHELADVSEQIGHWFAVGLFLYVSVLAVQVYGTSIPADRAARRWDVLRTTALRSREVVFGKLGGKLPVLLDPLLTATPVLTLLPLFGGVSPWFPVAVLACCVAVAVGLGGVALFYSVFAKYGRQAMAWTGVAVLAYLFVSVLANSLAVWLGSAGVGRVATAVAAGSPFLLFDRLTDPAANEGQMLAAVGRFVLFQLAVGLAFALVAVRRLPRGETWDFTAPVVPPKRWWRRTPAEPEPKPKPEIIRPPMSNWPIVWLELGGATEDQWQVIRYFSRKRCAVIAGVCTALCVVAAGGRSLLPESDFWRQLPTALAVLALLVVTAFTVPFAHMNLFLAARCVARERAANTLESLLLTPLTPRDILFQMWLGIMWCDWVLAMPILAVVLPLVLTGIVPVVVGVFYLVGWAVVAGALAAVGLAVSVRASTPLRASVTAGLLGASAVLALAGAALSSGPEYRVYAACVVLPPLATVTYPSDMCIPKGQPVANRDNDSKLVTAGFAAGIGLWGVVGGLAWRSAVRRLDDERNRAPAEPPA